MAQTPETAVASPPWAWDARRAGHLLILTFGRFCLNTILRVVYPFAPALSRGLGVPVTTIYLIISLRNLIGLFSPLFAPLSERYGRRAVMAAGIAAFALGLLLVAGVPTLWALAVALIVGGVVKVIFDPAMQSYLGDVVPYRQRGRALAVTEFAWSGAYLIGAPLTGWLIATQGWQSPFLWFGVASVVGAAMIWRGLPAARGNGRQAIGLSYTWQMLKRHPVIWAASAYMMLATLSQETLFIVYGDWMEGTFKLSLTSLGLATTLIGLAEAGGEATAGWSVDRFGKRPVVILAALLNVIAFLLIPFSTGSLNSAMAVLAVLFFTFEIAVVGAIPLLTELVPEGRAAVMSMSLGAMALGRTIGSLVGPLVWERFGVAGNSVLAASMMLIGALVVARWLHEGKEVPA